MAQRARAKNQSSLTRNVLIAGTSFAALAFGSAGMTLFGNNSYAAPAPYIVSRDALKLALVDPVAPPVVKRDPRLAIETPSAHVAARSEGQSTAVKAPSPQRVAKLAAPAKEMSAAARETLDSVPFPVPRPEQASSRERIALAFATDFTDQETTGSLGKAAVKPKAKSGPKSETVALPPAAAKLAALAPTKPAAPAKPARPLTPHEKLWGAGPVKVAALTPSDAMRDSANVATGGLPSAPYDPMTAVYVIGDRRVYMPDGSTLEAHSGYGQYMDDVRFAHMRMRGVTPPHVYTLKMREALFHGVEAIRMTPMQGEKAIFNRDGILAHTYMLGPNGQSHGCVSFKNYDAFLRAFKQGKINRLAVIGKLD